MYFLKYPLQESLQTWPCPAAAPVNTKVLWKSAFLYIQHTQPGQPHPRLVSGRTNSVWQDPTAAAHPGPGNWDKPEAWALNWKTSEEKHNFFFLPYAFGAPNIRNTGIGTPRYYVVQLSVQLSSVEKAMKRSQNISLRYFVFSCRTVFH